MNKPDCPVCGKTMTWDRHMEAWDCGPEPDGHGFWDRENFVPEEDNG